MNKDDIRLQAEQDLEVFISIVHPNRLLGGVHRELISWWNRTDSKSHQLVLLPRDHQKSAMIAYRAVWEITRNPKTRILYISSTSNLASKQIKFIKDILTSDTYRAYWPEMVNLDEAKREKWTEGEFSVDHPLRKAEAIRDPTVFTAGLTTNIAGLHCDIAILDDVVVAGNANTEDGRERTKQQYSLLASIEGTDAKEWVVGTRYHPNDLYSDLKGMQVDQYYTDGIWKETIPLYEVFERQVESRGDGTGEFLWPRQQRYDGAWFGFNQDELAKKRGQYLDKTQFRAQYYNDPNDVSTADIGRNLFQYFDKTKLVKSQGVWFYEGRRLNVFAAIDFAYSLAKRADFTAIVTIGVDSFHNYFVLDIDRFQTDKISEYFKHILEAYRKWQFRKLRAEVTAAQSAIVRSLKEDYIRSNGLAFSIDENKPSRHEGSKEERMQAVLQPRYANLQIYHYKGGNCQTLEEELVLRYPPHDDIKDALSNAIDIAVPPTGLGGFQRTIKGPKLDLTRDFINSRFGGIS